MSQITISLPRVSTDGRPTPANVEVPDTSVCICYPCPGSIHVLFHRSLMDLHAYDQQQGFNNLIAEKAVISGANISKARNELCSWALDETECEWVWFIDTDMVVNPNVLPKLLCAAEVSGAKVISALCVMIDDKDGPIPTIYQLGNYDQGEITRVVFDYPENTVTQVAATGAACLLIHRSVLEDIRDRFPSDKFPWFREDVINGNWVSEDLRFCLVANSCGHPVFVDCCTEVGHAKGASVWWPSDIKKSRGFPQLLNFVVIPVKDKLNLTKALVQQLRDQGQATKIIVCDNGSGGKTKGWLEKQDDLIVLDCPDVGIHEMWNEAVEWVIANGGQRRNVNVAFLNNDLHLGEEFLGRLSDALRSHRNLVAVSGNYDDRPSGDGLYQETADICATRYDGTGGFGGFAFMARGEWFQSGYRFPIECKWWFGDNDLIRAAEMAGGHVGIAYRAKVEHLGGGGQTAGDPLWSKFSEQLELDRQGFEARWARIQGARDGGSLESAYSQVCQTPSDIQEHLPTLVELCSRTDAKKVLELGVRSGVSTIAWLYGLCETDGQLFSVDPGTPPPLRHSRWTFIQGYDTDPFVLKQLSDDFDIVFIDTDHTYELTLEEIRTYAPKVRSGGCLVFHDTAEESFPHHQTEQPPFPVRKAVDELLGGENPIRQVAKVETYENNHGLTVVWFD